MDKANGLTTLYIDFDSFFASAEQYLQPRLAGRPVGVLPVMSEATCCIAASRQAKKFGVRTGTGVREAKALCPEIVFTVARHDEYVKLHHRIHRLVDNIVPVKAVRSIDEFTCQLMNNEQVRAEEIAARIKTALRETFSVALTCSIGFAPNELLAKLAAEMQKPDGLVLLYPEDLPRKIIHLPLRDVAGIGKGNEARLKAVNVTTMAQLWSLAPKQMRGIWGGVEGERMWAALHGHRTERTETSRCMFGHSRVLAFNWRNPRRVRLCARILLVKAARRMRREQFAAGALGLTLHCQEGPGLSGYHRFVTAARDDVHVLRALDGLLLAAFHSMGPRKPKFVHVMLYELVLAQDRSFDLFETAEDTTHLRQRWEKLSELTDALQTRFSPHALQLGCADEQVPGGYAGGKIAFNRVPDLADF